MANKKYDPDIVGWYTRGGKRIPVRDKKTKKECPPQYQHDKIKESMKRLSSDEFKDGTYEAETLTPVYYDKGFQTSFSQIGDNYLAEEFNGYVARFLAKTIDGKASLGKFKGAPELSFNIKSRAEAIKLAKEFNQESILDWEAKAKYPDDPEKWFIATGGTGRRKK